MQSTEIVLSNFLREIGLAKNTEEMFAALEKAALSLGFDHISYTYVPLVIGNNLNQLSPIFLISQSYEKKFITHYAAENFGQDDFTIKRIQNGDLESMIWWDESKKQTLTHKESRVIEVARYDYGIQHGITIPTHSSKKGIAGVSVTSTEKDRTFTILCKEKLEHMCIIAQIFSDRILVSPNMHMRFIQPFLKTLTNTEIIVLKKLSQGLVPKVIAHQLNSSPNYINHVITRLREKFGSLTRDQLLYYAGLINFDEIYPGG